MVRLQEQSGFNSENLEQLADMMTALGERQSQEQTARSTYPEALRFYEYLSDDSRNFSLQWLEENR